MLLGPSKRTTILLIVWILLVGCVIALSLSPGKSPLIRNIGRLHVNDKVAHFAMYLLVSFLPVVGISHRRKGLTLGLSMFILGIVLELGQHFCPGRSPELGDIAANGIGVACGVSLARQIRNRVAISPESA